MSEWRFPEDDYSIEERLNAIAKLLLAGVKRLIAARRRAKVQRWRQRQHEAAASKKPVAETANQGRDARRGDEDSDGNP